MCTLPTHRQVPACCSTLSLLPGPFLTHAQQGHRRWLYLHRRYLPLSSPWEMLNQVPSTSVPVSHNNKQLNTVSKTASESPATALIRFTNIISSVAAGVWYHCLTCPHGADWSALEQEREWVPQKRTNKTPKVKWPQNNRSSLGRH